mgnify:CR=1 FL=1
MEERTCIKNKDLFPFLFPAAFLCVIDFAPFRAIFVMCHIGPCCVTIAALCHYSVRALPWQPSGGILAAARMCAKL